MIFSKSSSAVFSALVCALALCQNGLAAERAKPVIRATCESAPARIGMLSNEPMHVNNTYFFTDRSYRLERSRKIDAKLERMYFFMLPIGADAEYEVLKGGEAVVLAPTNEKANLEAQLKKMGFVKDESIAPYAPQGDGDQNTFCVYRKKVEDGEKFKGLKPWMLVAGFDPESRARSGEVLYNGIELPNVWPPKNEWSDKPMPVPWLEEKPKLIDISVGRQLFVDDFLIEGGNFEREFHYPEKYEGNPVLKAETPLEKGKKSRNQPGATVKSGGIWWNPEKNIFEMWYEAGWVQALAYATSKDGVNWERPKLGIYGDDNRIVDEKFHPDSGAAVRDFQSTDPAQNYKMFNRGGGSAKNRITAFTSTDGVHFDVHPLLGTCQDRTTAFYNPFRKKWVYSIRASGPRGRSRMYYENSDFLKASNWLPDEPVVWASADELDLPSPHVPDFRPNLYNLDAVAYESLMLGFFQIMTGPENDVCTKLGLPKGTNLSFAYSRDGFHWHRPDRTFAIASTYEDTWDRGYVQSLSNICLVRGDKLWFYYIGYAGDPSMASEDKSKSMSSGMYSNGATGVAVLRRDGFASLNPKGGAPMEITTRPLLFQGKYLFVNADSPKGKITAELLDMKDQKIEPFTFENCEPLSADSTMAQIKWNNAEDLSALAYRPVKIRFRMDGGKFYSFWVSVDKNGRSDGYVAGGGPGYTSNVDTVGIGALEAEERLQKNLAP